MAQASSGGNEHWALMVDEATKYKKSFFLKRKFNRSLTYGTLLGVLW